MLLDLGTHLAAGFKNALGRALENIAIASPFYLRQDLRLGLRLDERLDLRFDSRFNLRRDLRLDLGLDLRLDSRLDLKFDSRLDPRKGFEKLGGNFPF